MENNKTKLIEELSDALVDLMELDECATHRINSPKLLEVAKKAQKIFANAEDNGIQYEVFFRMDEKVNALKKEKESKEKEGDKDGDRDVEEDRKIDINKKNNNVTKEVSKQFVYNRKIKFSIDLNKRISIYNSFNDDNEFIFNNSSIGTIKMFADLFNSIIDVYNREINK